jgi:hypothetical protein
VQQAVTISAATPLEAAIKALKQAALADPDDDWDERMRRFAAVLADLPAPDGRRAVAALSAAEVDFGG